LLLLYPTVLAGIVLLAWPENERLDMTNPQASRRLINLLFLGQFLLGSLLAPTFAAAAITGEKERQTFELLVASPLRPGAIVLGKLLASLCHILVMLVVSLPIVVLCLPLGGVSIYEVLAAYFALLVSLTTFGLLSLAASSYFRRTLAALTVSYLLILPLVALGVASWIGLEQAGTLRLYAIGTVLPVLGGILCVLFYEIASRQLLYPTGLGSEGKQVVDEEQENREAMGLVIRRGEFPDRLFAPAKRDDLLPDGANPVLDKEMRSEIFSQGTLMLRVVIQISMLLALPMMFFCFYLFPQLAPWYVDYVVLFNLLVGPIFSAAALTSERERRTLELLLTTLLQPRQILWAKLAAGLRVSSVLTMFLLWPLLLACVLVSYYWSNVPTMLIYVLIVLITCLTTATVALACSVVARKTSMSLLLCYVILAALFLGPPGGAAFTETFFPGRATDELSQAAAIASPLVIPFHVPLKIDSEHFYDEQPLAWIWFSLLYAAILAALMSGMLWMFQRRWRLKA